MLARSRMRPIAALLPLLLLLALLPRPAAAQGNPALLRAGDETLTLQVGQVVEVPIVLENAYEAFAIDVRMRFDPAALEVVDANDNQPGVQVAQGDFIKPDFAVQYGADNVAGTISYVVTQTSPTPPASGSGTIFTVSLRAKTPGSSLLQFDTVEMADRNGFLLEVTTRDTQVNANGTGGQTAVTPGAAITAPTATSPAAGAAGASTATAVPAAAATSAPAAAATSAPAENSAAVAPSPLPNATVAPAATAVPDGAGAPADQTAPTAAPAEQGASGEGVAVEEVQVETVVDPQPQPEAAAEIAAVEGAPAETGAEAPDGQAAAPVVIGSGADAAAGVDAAVPAGAQPAAQEEGGGNTTLLLLLALLLLAAGAVGLIVLLSRRGAAS